MSEYQKMPLPSQLTARNSGSSVAKRSARFARTHTRSSQRWIAARAGSSRNMSNLRGPRRHRGVEERALEIVVDALPGQALGDGARHGAEAPRQARLAHHALRGREE